MSVNMLEKISTAIDQNVLLCNPLTDLIKAIGKIKIFENPHEKDLVLLS